MGYTTLTTASIATAKADVLQTPTTFSSHDRPGVHIVRASFRLLLDPQSSWERESSVWQHELAFSGPNLHFITIRGTCTDDSLIWSCFSMELCFYYQLIATFSTWDVLTRP